MHIKYTRLLISLIVIALVAYGAYSLSITFSRPNIRVDLSQSSVVTKIQGLNKIETAQFTLEKIIDAGYQGNFFQNVLYGDRILLIAHADIIAGFDLAKVTKDDVKVRGTQLVIDMPAPEILTSRLDNEKTKVYDRRTGFLAASDKDLESQARAQAEAAIKKDACDAGILDTASENAKEQLELLFKAAGFAEVVIIIPAGNCN
jgi:hypothetical protein